MGPGGRVSGALGGALVGGAGVAWLQNREEQLPPMPPALEELDWVQRLAAQDGVKQITFPGRMLRTHPVGALLTSDDHLVRATRAVTAQRAVTWPQ